MALTPVLAIAKNRRKAQALYHIDRTGEPKPARPNNS